MKAHPFDTPCYSFDSACYDLAEHFYPGAPEKLLNELAQRIQDQCEVNAELDDWLERKAQE